MLRPLRAAKMVAPSTSTGGMCRVTGEPTRVCRFTWMFAGVSGTPVTIHSAPEVKTCRCWPEKSPRIAFTWSETRPKTIDSSSSPVPVLKLKRSPVCENQSRFGRSREPPSTRRSWWKHSVAGQPRTCEKAGSSQSRVASRPWIMPSTVASAWVGETTPRM